VPEAGCDIPVIAEVLAAFVSAPEANLVHTDPQIDLRGLAAEFNVLPVLLDMGGCFGLRRNGEVVSFPWDEPHKLQVESDERIRNMVLFRAGVRYSPLAGLAPERPPSAPTCPHCGGSGSPNGLPERLARSVICYCGGLGWLPKGSDLTSVG
jgi:hypothetical protein